MCGGSGSGPPILNGVLWVVSPHRSVGGDQVTLTVPCSISRSNETPSGAPTAEKEVTQFVVYTM